MQLVYKIYTPSTCMLKYMHRCLEGRLLWNDVLRVTTQSSKSKISTLSSNQSKCIFFHNNDVPRFTRRQRPCVKCRLRQKFAS